MRRGLAILWVLGMSAGLARTENAHPLFSGTRAGQAKEETQVSYPFGKITLHLDEPFPPTPSSEPSVGRRHAETRGTFTLTYELVPRGRSIEVKRLNIKNVNVEIYHSSATPRLREHEAMHRKINEHEAEKIEEQLRRFTARNVTAIEAEKRLRQRFREELDRVRRLHEDWDENDIFIAAPAKDPSME